MEVEESEPEENNVQSKRNMRSQTKRKWSEVKASTEMEMIDFLILHSSLYKMYELIFNLEKFYNK